MNIHKVQLYNLEAWSYSGSYTTNWCSISEDIVVTWKQLCNMLTSALPSSYTSSHGSYSWLIHTHSLVSVIMTEEAVSAISESLVGSFALQFNRFVSYILKSATVIPIHKKRKKTVMGLFLWHPLRSGFQKVWWKNDLTTGRGMALIRLPTWFQREVLCNAVLHSSGNWGLELIKVEENDVYTFRFL